MKWHGIRGITSAGSPAEVLTAPLPLIAADRMNRSIEAALPAICVQERHLRNLPEGRQARRHRLQGRHGDLERNRGRVRVRGLPFRYASNRSRRGGAQGLHARRRRRRHRSDREISFGGSDRLHLERGWSVLGVCGGEGVAGTDGALMS